VRYKADLYIDGEWRGGGGGRRFPVLDPADGSDLASFAVTEESDCIAAVGSPPPATSTSW
jgi:succinate-semialdehyde dehydrogenase / glutarate-semialdehyde dehydrogenase